MCESGSVPGVVDSSWAEVVDLLANDPFGRAKALVIARAAAGGEAAAATCPACARLIVEHSSEERKACHDACSGFQRAAGGERPSVSLRETIEIYLCPLCGARSALAGHPRLDDITKTCPGGPVLRYYAYPAQVEREAEEGERDA